MVTWWQCKSSEPPSKTKRHHAFASFGYAFAVLGEQKVKAKQQDANVVSYVSVSGEAKRTQRRVDTPCNLPRSCRQMLTSSKCQQVIVPPYYTQSDEEHGKKM